MLNRLHSQGVRNLKTFSHLGRTCRLALNLLLLLLLLSAPNAHAGTIDEYAIRILTLKTACTNHKGKFEVFKSATDTLPLCRWKLAVIDAQSIVSNVDGVQSEAASIILGDLVQNSCDLVGGTATDITYRNSRGVVKTQTVCLFTDGSVLSLDAVEADVTNADRIRIKDSLTLP